jgi:tetratricopeptide (TPR) repeat protein
LKAHLDSQSRIETSSKPSDLDKTIFHVPYDRNPHFTGRDDLLQTIRNEIHDEQKGWKHHVALYGLGGVGKTQLALQYCYESKQHYDYIFWLSATDQTRLLNSFREVAILTGHEQQIAGQTPEVIAQTALRWLRSKEKWIVVFDNLDDIEIVNGYLPRIDSGGHVLITTRNNNTDGIPAQGLEVPILDPNHAITLLRNRSELDEAKFPTPLASEIVRELGYLPLAIEQVAAYIRMTIKNIDEFLPIYRKSRPRILSRSPKGNNPYRNSVATSFLLSFKKLKTMEHGKHAANLLQLFSFLTPDGILIDFLRSGSKGLSGSLRKVVEDKFSFYEALELLERFSLIRRSRGEGDIIIVHRLVQVVLKDNFSASELKDWRSEVLELCSSAMPENIEHHLSEDANRLRRYENQLLESLVDVAKVGSIKAASTLSRAAWFLEQDCKYNNSVRLMKLSVAIFESLFGDQDSRTLAAMHQLAMIYWGCGSLKEAEDLEDKVLKTTQRVLGEEHPYTLAMTSELALIYWSRGKLEEAEELGRRAAEADKRILGDEHQQTLMTLANLALTYNSLRRYEKAEEVGEKVVEARKRVLGEGDLDTLTSMHNLALSYQSRGKLKEAADMERKVLEARIKALGEEHSDTLISMTMLAGMYREQGNLEEAADMGARALEASRKVLGEEHTYTLLAGGNLSLTYRNQGKLQEAADLGKAIVETLRRVLGGHHPHTVEVMTTLATIFWRQNKQNEAVDLIRETVTLSRSIWGDNHTEVLWRNNILNDWVGDKEKDSDKM